MATPNKAHPYGFAPSLERVAVLLSCSRPSFWRRLGYALDPESLPEGAPRRAISAAGEIARESGSGPASCQQVIQRLGSWRELGRATTGQVREVDAYLADAEDDLEAWPEDAVIAETCKILKPRLEQQALVKGMSTWSERGDLTPVAEEILRAGRVGDSNTGTGTVFSGDMLLDAVIDRRLLLPTGIPLLDGALGGGVARGELCCVVGGTGDGKSMFLTQITAEAALYQKFVAYASLEVTRGPWSRRLSGNLTAIPLDMLKSGEGMELAREKLRALKTGRVVYNFFTANATTVAELKTWVKEEEARAGQTVDLIVVDYADLLLAGDDDEYLGARTVYTSLRAWATEEKCPRWMWTAAQAKRKARGQKDVRTEDIADSIHKARIADTLVTLYLNEDTREIDIYLGKGRDLEGRKMVTTEPEGFATGMIVNVDRADMSRYEENAGPTGIIL